jgi:hypothetical protein
MCLSSILNTALITKDPITARNKTIPQDQNSQPLSLTTSLTSYEKCAQFQRASDYSHSSKFNYIPVQAMKAYRGVEM